mmetsp:Transcript_95184/g.220940  ORF Transcript_95184/g.220940 Transcript_95184/m.220940 type:complete len:189 (-) Transcript_95184:79-645(-)
MAKAVLLLAFLLALATPAVAYVVPTQGASPERAAVSRTADTLKREAQAEASGAFSIGAATFAIGALLGWLNQRRQHVASATAAAAVALAPAAAPAIVDFESIKYLGGTDKVDINNANVQAYRQFPGFYPTAAGFIVTNGPFNSVADIYNIKGVDEKVKAIFKKYEANLVCTPANPAYFIDRVNNGMYR